MAPTAIVREVGPRLAAGEVTHRRRVPVDVERAQAQHAAYAELLRARGWRPRFAPAEPDLPDAVFVEDAAVVVDRSLAVLARPGALSRRAETPTIEPILSELVRSTVRIREPATLDGGDVLRVGTTLYVGISTRTNRAGLDQLTGIVAPLGLHVTGVDVRGCLHLKTGATALPDGAVIAIEEWIEVAALGEREIVAAEEPSGANVLVLGPSAVAVSASAPTTARSLRRRGLDVEVVDISEFEALEAGLTCLSILVA